MDITPIPELRAVREMYTDLLGREVEIARTHEPLDVSRDVVAGAYIDARKRLEAVVAVDIPLAAYLGACIGLIPAGGAQDAADSGKLSATLLENVAEVLNITAALFNDEDAPHLKLDRAYDSSREPLPGDVATALASTNRRVDADLEVTGYGSGRLAIVVRGAVW